MTTGDREGLLWRPLNGAVYPLGAARRKRRQVLSFDGLVSGEQQSSKNVPFNSFNFFPRHVCQFVCYLIFGFSDDFFLWSNLFMDFVLCCWLLFVPDAPDVPDTSDVPAVAVFLMLHEECSGCSPKVKKTKFNWWSLLPMLYSVWLYFSVRRDTCAYLSIPEVYPCTHVALIALTEPGTGRSERVSILPIFINWAPGGRLSHSHSIMKSIQMQVRM